MEISNNQNFNIPEITEDIVMYKGEEYKLVRMSKEAVKRTGTPTSISQGGVLAIEGSKIFCYNVPEEYLPYTLINEIECSEVTDGEDLCLIALQQELKQVPYVTMDDYLVWRKTFFQNMERFHLEIGEDQFYAGEMVKCYQWLNSEIERRKVISEISGMVGNI